MRVVRCLVFAFLHKHDPMLEKLPIITATSPPPVHTMNKAMVSYALLIILPSPLLCDLQEHNAASFKYLLVVVDVVTPTLTTFRTRLRFSHRVYDLLHGRKSSKR